LENAVEITEIRIKLMGDGSDKLKAFCSITVGNEFVIRDLKIIEGAKGLFVAMPSRKLADHCPRCRNKNHLRAGYCNECGTRLRPDRADTDNRGRARLHVDVAHPINSECRDAVQRCIIAAYEHERERSRQEGYVPTTFDDLDYAVDAEYIQEVEDRQVKRGHLGGSAQAGG
jgi:stage V sporulation protein G